MAARAKSAARVRDLRFFDAPLERSDRRHPLRPFADRLAAYRRRADGAVQPIYMRDTTGGNFLLRIEDTDRERSTAANVDRSSSTALKLAGRDARQCRLCSRPPRRLAPCGGGAGDARRGAAAYRDWTTQRGRLRRRGRSHARRGAWCARSGATANEDGPADQPFAVRLRAPQTGETLIADLIKGDVTCSATPSSTIWCCSAPTARRPTISPWSSTITTWASPT